MSTSILPFTVNCSVALPPATVSKLTSTFTSFIYRPTPAGSLSSEFTSSELASADIFFTRNTGVPHPTLDDLPKLKLVQLCSAGADKAIASPALKGHVEGVGKHEGREVLLATAAGTHVLSIPNYAVGMVILLLHQLPRQIIGARNEQRWLSEEDCDMDGEAYYARSTAGRTVGLLGYGALGRETARLLKAHGMRVIAANTTGKATPQDGYIIPGTGDKDGSIPEEYFSTKDPKAVEAFLKQSDVLIASLPNTPATKYFLNKEKLAMLPPNAVIVNVGRGTLIPSDDLLEALNTPNQLFGAALDVTDPEPLPASHPLWSHPKCVITPHLSGNTENEMDIAADILVANAKRLAEGKGVVNKVHWERGY
ncbi:hypothetical protein IAT38_006992 [Cryptococcus sp. DSM 104549]